MTQTNEIVYRNRINETVKTWNAQIGKNEDTSAEKGTIIASDGTCYKKVNGRLVQVLEGTKSKSAKKVILKLENDGLLNLDTAKNKENISNAYASNYIAEL